MENCQKWVRPQLDLVSASVRNRPDVSQLSLVGFRCGKVENLGGRGMRMKKRGSNVWVVLYDLNDLLFFLTLCKLLLVRWSIKWSLLLSLNSAVASTMHVHVRNYQLRMNGQQLVVPVQSRSRSVTRSRLQVNELSSLQQTQLWGSWLPVTAGWWTETLRWPRRSSSSCTSSAHHWLIQLLHVRTRCLVASPS